MVLFIEIGYNGRWLGKSDYYFDFDIVEFENI